jgi:hypothetical protein
LTISSVHLSSAASQILAAYVGKQALNPRTASQIGYDGFNRATVTHIGRIHEHV